MCWSSTFYMNKQPNVQIDHHKCNIEKIIYWISYIQPLTLWLFVPWGFCHGCFWLFKEYVNKGFFFKKRYWKIKGFSQKFSKNCEIYIRLHMFSKSLPILGWKKSFIVKLFQECRVFSLCNFYALLWYWIQYKYFDVEFEEECNKGYP